MAVTYNVYAGVTRVRPHRSAVAWKVGVAVVPGLIAVNGPNFREDVRVFTVRFVLIGLLLEQEQEWLLDLVSAQITQFLNSHTLNVMSLLTMCIPGGRTPSACAAASSPRYTHSSSRKQNCTPAVCSDLS